MRTAFGHWKYIFKNIWFVLPFAILPAVFLALSLDHSGIGAVVHAFFTGDPRMDFLGFFKAFSFIRVDSVLGGIYSVFAYLSVAGCTAFLLTFAEKHMRIGKRSMSGVGRGVLQILPSAFLISLWYVAIYELWAVILSAMAFAISAIRTTGLVYFLFIVAFLVLSYALVYVATIAYLWLPCRQLTGFGPYIAFVYSYRLMMGVRWPLILSYTVSLCAAFVVIGGMSVLPAALFRIVGAILFAFLFLSFTLRMETVYFSADRLVREDEVKSYRGY